MCKFISKRWYLDKIMGGALCCLAQSTSVSLVNVSSSLILIDPKF
jgi:hypothetical protein